jgi:hypothetical protein
MMSDKDVGTILVDAHVHVYDCFDIDDLLSAALRNFKHAAANMGLADNFTGVLLLSETSRDNWFSQASTAGRLKCWRIEPVQENLVMQAELLNNTTEKNIIYIMAGRQIATAEGIELLALITGRSFEDGLSVEDSLTAVREQDAIPVLPWAVGKWLGKRGKILSGLLKAEAGSDLCIGDNSGRPVFWHNPSHFKQARALAMPLLSGSDPLPLAGEAERVGRFGFSLQGELGPSQPATDLKCLLREKGLKVKAYGRLENPWNFVTNQIRLRKA